VGVRGPSAHAAVAGPDGRYEIAAVPPGNYQIAVWNPRLHGADRSVTIAAGTASAVDFAIAR